MKQILAGRTRKSHKRWKTEPAQLQEPDWQVGVSCRIQLMGHILVADDGRARHEQGGGQQVHTATRCLPPMVLEIWSAKSAQNENPCLSLAHLKLLAPTTAQRLQPDAMLSTEEASSYKRQGPTSRWCWLSVKCFQSVWHIKVGTRAMQRHFELT